MKKRTIIALAIVSLCMLLPGSVKAQFRYGVKGGMNVNTVHFNKNKLDPDAAVGYYIGPTMEVITRPLNLGFELSFLFSQRGLSYHNKQYNHNYLEIPLNMKWKIGLPFGKLYVAAGPYFATCVGDKEWKVPKASASSSSSGYIKVRADKKDIGINAGIGIEFLRHFQAGFNYRYGISDAYTVVWSGTTYAQNRSYELNVAFLF